MRYGVHLLIIWIAPFLVSCVGSVQDVSVSGTRPKSNSLGYQEGVHLVSSTPYHYFGYLSINGASSQILPLTITNLGTESTSSCSSPAIEGNDSSHFSIQESNCENLILAKGSSCQIYATALPTSVGLKQAEAVLRCGEEQISVPLSVFGSAVQLDETITLSNVTWEFLGPANGLISSNRNPIVMASDLPISLGTVVIYRDADCFFPIGDSTLQGDSVTVSNISLDDQLDNEEIIFYAKIFDYSGNYSSCTDLGYRYIFKSNVFNTDEIYNIDLIDNCDVTTNDDLSIKAIQSDETFVYLLVNVEGDDKIFQISSTNFSCNSFDLPKDDSTGMIIVSDSIYVSYPYTVVVGDPIVSIHERGNPSNYQSLVSGDFGGGYIPKSIDEMVAYNDGTSDYVYLANSVTDANGCTIEVIKDGVYDSSITVDNSVNCKIASIAMGNYQNSSYLYVLYRGSDLKEYLRRYSIGNNGMPSPLAGDVDFDLGLYFDEMHVVVSDESSNLNEYVYIVMGNTNRVAMFKKDWISGVQYFQNSYANRMVNPITLIPTDNGVFVPAKGTSSLLFLEKIVKTCNSNSCMDLTFTQSYTYVASENDWRGLDQVDAVIDDASNLYVVSSNQKIITVFKK